MKLTELQSKGISLLLEEVECPEYETIETSVDDEPWPQVTKEYYNKEDKLVRWDTLGPGSYVEIDILNDEENIVFNGKIYYREDHSNGREWPFCIKETEKYVTQEDSSKIVIEEFTHYDENYNIIKRFVEEY